MVITLFERMKIFLGIPSRTDRSMLCGASEFFTLDMEHVHELEAIKLEKNEIQKKHMLVKVHSSYKQWKSS